MLNRLQDGTHICRKRPRYRSSICLHLIASNQIQSFRGKQCIEPQLSGTTTTDHPGIPSAHAHANRRGGKSLLIWIHASASVGDKRPLHVTTATGLNAKETRHCCQGNRTLFLSQQIGRNNRPAGKLKQEIDFLKAVKSPRQTSAEISVTDG